MRDMSNSGYALLVGVNDYGAYDRSEGNAPGTSDLRGSLNDVRAWLATCLEIGIPRENIRVLSSPAASMAELGGAQGGPATAAVIREGVLWLAEKLKGATQPVGLFMFSGHGDLTKNDGLVICPTDVTASGDDLVNDVSGVWMQGVLGGCQNLTAVLDCCHSGGGTAAGSRKLTSLRGRAWPSDAAAQPAMPAISDRMFFAAQRGQSAYQAAFMAEQVYGAFTWAFMTVKSQYTMAQDGGTRVLTISYGEMQQRALMLLEALSFGQTPELQCATDVMELPLFNPGEEAKGIACEVAPDAKRTGIQCDPGDRDYRIYELTWQMIGDTTSPTLIARVLVSKNGFEYNKTTYAADTEYWLMTQEATTLNGQDSSLAWGQLTITWNSYDLPSALDVDEKNNIETDLEEFASTGQRVYQTSAQPQWQPPYGYWTTPGAPQVFCGALDGDNIGMNWYSYNNTAQGRNWIEWMAQNKTQYAIGTNMDSGKVVLTSSQTVPQWLASAYTYVACLVAPERP